MDSRNEDILTAMINGTEYEEVPQSRMEALLLELKDINPLFRHPTHSVKGTASLTFQFGADLVVRPTDCQLSIYHEGSEIWSCTHGNPASETEWNELRKIISDDYNSQNIVTGYKVMFWVLN